MLRRVPRYHVSFAEEPGEVRAALRLRHEVFVRELGAPDPDPEGCLESDRFDPHCRHLLLRDGDEVVGTYRLLDEAGAARAGGFYGEGEYDISPLRAARRPLLELGRSCVRADHRGGAALAEMWAALARHVDRGGASILFGVASFHGADPAPLGMTLSHLAHAHLAPPELRPVSRAYVPMDTVPPECIDRVAAMRAVPPLMKSYLRLGGFVGEGAFVDRSFNTVDVCLVLDVERIPRILRMRSGWAA